MIRLPIEALYFCRSVYWLPVNEECPGVQKYTEAIMKKFIYMCNESYFIREVSPSFNVNSVYQPIMNKV